MLVEEEKRKGEKRRRPEEKKKREEKEKHFPSTPVFSVRHASPPAISQIYKVPSPKHLGRGTVSPTQRLVTPSTHSMLSYCFDVNESAW